jgi:cell division protease FtsH
MSRDYALKRLAVMMGGRAAEKVIFDELTTGAGNDIEVATDLARKMVCEWGMSDEIGPLSYSSKNSNPFPGYGGSNATRPYSEAVAREIDSEVRGIVTNQYDLAETLLRDNHSLLELMAQALLEFEALDREEIDILLANESLDPLRERRKEQAAKDEKAAEERVPKTGFTSRLKEQTLGSGLDLEPST